MLFLAGAGHGYCKKRQKWTRRYLLSTAVSSKKGDFNTPSVFSFLKKENGGLKFFISKPPFCAATLWPITTVLLCGVKEHQRKSYQKKSR
jgi:hypothetical protein